MSCVDVPFLHRHRSRSSTLPEALFQTCTTNIVNVADLPTENMKTFTIAALATLAAGLASASLRCQQPVRANHPGPVLPWGGGDVWLTTIPARCNELVHIVQDAGVDGGLPDVDIGVGREQLAAVAHGPARRGSGSQLKISRGGGRGEGVLQFEYRWRTTCTGTSATSTARRSATRASRDADGRGARQARARHTNGCSPRSSAPPARSARSLPVPGPGGHARLPLRRWRPHPRPLHGRQREAQDDPRLADVVVPGNDWIST